jgi:hypothetical protein
MKHELVHKNMDTTMYDRATSYYYVTYSITTKLSLHEYTILKLLCDVDNVAVFQLGF